MNIRMGDYCDVSFVNSRLFVCVRLSGIVNISFCCTSTSFTVATNLNGDRTINYAVTSTLTLSSMKKSAMLSA